MNKRKIAVLFGGCSEEHDISVKSAIRLADCLDPEKYIPIYIGITKSGIWKRCAKPCKNWEETADEQVFLSPSQGNKGLLQISGNHFQKIDVDIVFPMLHGRCGEDGCIQGLLELAGIPYVGCGVAASALCMDKSLTYLVAARAGIPVPEHWVLHDDRLPEGLALPYPVFVKPARSGSSFGVTKVISAESLPPAIALARRYDQKVLIERAVTGTEVGCSVLGSGENLTVGEVDQVTLSGGFFRIHQEPAPEQGSENSHITVPADISPAETKAVKETAVAVFRALGCGGLARVDLFLCPDGQIILNEVNTMPGFTSYSRYPRMMEAAGWALPQVVDRLMEDALREARP